MRQRDNFSIRILNWRDIYHPLAGGAEASLHEQAKVWIKNGADITWYSASWRGAKKEEVIDKVRVVRMGNQFTIHILFFLRFIFKKIPYTDVCIDAFHFIPFFSPFFIRGEKIFALINEVAGDLWFYNAPMPVALLGKKIEPLIIKSYEKVPFITASTSTQNELIKLGIPSKKIYIVPHGVTIINPSSYIKKEKNPTMLFLNRISTDKGIEDVLKAFSILQKEQEALALWIVGKEEKDGILRELFVKYKISSGVTYFGFVSQKEKFELMKKAWMLVHPSKKEGWGLTVIEAASQGTPTIGYDVEGLRDSIVHNKTGLLVEPNVQGIVNGVEKITNDAKLREKLSTNCVDWSKSFSWKKAGEKSWEVINE